MPFTRFKSGRREAMSANPVLLNVSSRSTGYFVFKVFTSPFLSLIMAF